MPKLLQLNAVANWGSTGKIVEQIGLKAQESGWDSFVAFGRHMNPSKLELIKVGSIPFVYEHFLENRFLDREGLASRLPTYRLINQMKNLKPDVVQLHNIHDHWLNYPQLFRHLAKEKVPVVWTFHDCWAFTGHCALYYDDCVKWKTGCGNCPHKFNYCTDRSSYNYILKKELFNSIKNLTIVPVSDWMGEKVKESFLGQHKIRVIHNGIDLKVFKPTESAIRKKYGIAKNLVLGVAQVWSKKKGLNDFFALRNRLCDDYSILLVGLSHDQIKSLPNGIIGLTRTGNVFELAKLYAAADVFANPTYSDTFPTVNIEALACGTPIVTYRTGGSPEAVDEKTGVVVEQGDLDGLCSAIFEVAKKGKEYYSASCRKRAEMYFDKEKCFKNYIELYNGLMEN